MKRYIINCLLLFVLLLSCACSGQEADNPEDSLSRARAAFSQAKYLEAEREYEAYLQKAPAGHGRKEAWSRLAGIAENVRNDPEAAVSLLETAVLEYTALNQQEATDLLIINAGLYEQLKQWDKAVELNKRILNIADLPPAENALTQQRLARALQALGQFDLAQEALLACVQTAGDAETKASCRLSLARNAALISDPAQAKEVLENIIKEDIADETRAIAIFNLADIIEKEGDKKRSRELFKSILEIYPNRPVVEARLSN